MIIRDYKIDMNKEGYCTHTKLVTEPYTKRGSNGGKNKDS